MGKITIRTEQSNNIWSETTREDISNEVLSEINYMLITNKPFTHKQDEIKRIANRVRSYISQSVKYGRKRLCKGSLRYSITC